MRVRFSTDPSDVEIGVHLARMRSTVAFWQAIDAALHAPSAIPRAKHLLAEIDPELELEIEGTRVCVRGVQEGAHPLAQSVVAAAPERDGWQFVVDRAPAPLDEALRTIRRTTGLDFCDAEVRVGVGRGHLLDVVVRASCVSSAEDEAGRDAAQALCRRLLGDSLFSDWIGAVDVEPQKRKRSLLVVADSVGTPWYPLSEFAQTVQAAHLGVHAGMSAAPFHSFCDSADWVLFELEPGAVGDARSIRGQDDLLTATTMLPELWKCYLQGEPFSSRRFSATGETFLYVKYLSALSDSPSRLGERSMFEDALNFRMVPSRKGCVVGSGVGVHYNYIVLAVQDLDTAIDVTLRTLRDQRMGRAAWLLFCDDRMAREWIPVWPNSGTPPCM